MSLRLASAGRWAAVAALLIASCLSAEAADPFARATVQAPSPIRPGEQVKIDIDVLVPNFFMSPPQFPLFDLPNAVVVLADGATNINETVGGVDFAGIRRSYLVTPQVPGDYALPPAAITFTYAAVPGQPSPGSVPLPPAPFSVEGTQGAAAAAPAAGRVDVSQTVEPDTGKLKVGDALVRTVVVAADDMQAMLIPAPQFSTPEGVRLYRHDPKLVDERSPRGDFVGGRRTDAATYVFERAGTFVLPEVAVGQTFCSGPEGRGRGGCDCIAARSASAGAGFGRGRDVRPQAGAGAAGGRPARSRRAGCLPSLQGASLAGGPAVASRGAGDVGARLFPPFQAGLPARGGRRSLRPARRMGAARPAGSAAGLAAPIERRGGRANLRGVHGFAVRWPAERRGGDRLCPSRARVRRCQADLARKGRLGRKRVGTPAAQPLGAARGIRDVGQSPRRTGGSAMAAA